MSISNNGSENIGLRIKRLREERELSMRELATRANVTASLISKIEAGKVSPTVASLQKIISGMDVDMYEFFRHGTEEDPSEQIVFKQSDMAASEDAERKWYYAFPKHQNIRLQFTHEEYQPHTKAVEMESHRGDLAGIVIAGSLTIEVVNKGKFIVDEGDAFYVKAGQLHSARNDGDVVVRLVTAEIRNNG